jgi:hypothetical protein
MAANVTAWRCGGLVAVSAGNRCRIEILKIKIATKSQIEILLPEPK